jgi:murein DD-endopeptidase MepM/ murein hydrolase activator NlpD
MAKRRWTILLVPNGAAPSKVLEVSRGLLRFAGTLGVVLFVSALLVGYATVSRRLDLSRTAALEAENQRLVREIDDLSGRLEHLSDTIALISRRDARIRVLANLEPIDPQVQAAGIGGPAALGTLADLSTPALKRANDVRVDLNALIRRANMLASSFGTAADSLRSHKERLAATPSIMPTQGWLTSAFSSMRAHPVLHVARPHEGIDVSAPMGTPI